MHQYRVEWIGTADVHTERGFDHRIPISGWLTIDMEQDEMAQALYDDDDETLMDVDFISPHGTYSASNPHITEGELFFGFARSIQAEEPEEWVFHNATVLRVMRQATRWEPIYPRRP